MDIEFVSLPTEPTCRRHLRSHEWGEAFKLLLAERGVERRRGPKRKDGISAKVAEIAAEAGVLLTTAEKRVRAHDAYEKLPTKTTRSAMNVLATAAFTAPARNANTSTPCGQQRCQRAPR